MANKAVTTFPLMLIRAAGLPLQWLNELTLGWPDEADGEIGMAKGVQDALDVALAALPESPLRTAVYNIRKDFFQRGKLPNARSERELTDNLALPAIAQLVENLNSLKKKRDERAAFEAQYENALQSNQETLQRAARDENLRRALLFASHDLLDRMPVFCQKTAAQFAKKDRQTALSLLQYLTRAAVKTSPLSRFTTVSTWPGKKEVGIENNGIFSAPKSVVVPNVALLPALYEILLREPAFCHALSISLNPCVTQNGQGLWLYFDGEHEAFQEIEAHPIADFVVKILLEHRRELPFPELLAQMENEIDASAGALQNLVYELIDLGLLEWALPEKGLSPGWCGGLYHFLGFLKNQSPVVVEAAALLQWLRTAARTLPFQKVEEAQETQREAVRMTRVFFEKNGGAMPPIPTEQIFFEDVEIPVEVEVPEKVVSALAEDLAACWRDNEPAPLSPFRARLFSFAEKMLYEGQSVGFLSFSKKFFQEKTTSTNEAGGTGPNRAMPPGKLKIGALLQIFKDEKGEFRAVVNGLFPGGGKLFARWSHLLPAEMQEALEGWQDDAIPFPWQGWSNANFQPAVSNKNLAVPDGRTRPLPGGDTILFGNLSVLLKENGLQLIDIESQTPIRMTDLGLETPQSRPPAMQVLWHLGVPHISLEALLPKRHWAKGGDGWHFTERIEYDRLVLARKAWKCEPAMVASWFSGKNEVDFFRRSRAAMAAAGVPRRFFARFAGQKPQYFDRDSPVSMQLLAKMLRQAPSSPVLLTEMLPLPEQCVVRQGGSLRAAEFVLELGI